jgi:predicted secreted protein
MMKRISGGVIAVTLILAAGCGDDGATSDGRDPVPSTAPPGAVAARDVTLDIAAGSNEIPDALGASIRIVDGATETNGYIDDADAVTAVLADAAARARLVDGPTLDVACTKQYGGPDVAHVEGTIDGREVDTQFHRSDGCGIADWDLVQAILPPPLWSTDAEATVGDAVNPVILPVGQRFTVQLQANATTGYSWEIAVPAGLAVVDDRYEEPDDAGVVGAGGVQVFEIAGVDVGAAVIELTYRQPFDEDGEPAETRTFHVEVVDGS